MTKLIAITSLLLLTGCSLFPNIKFVPKAHMPTPPELLMKPPKELNTIQPPVAEAKKPK
jgi:uncharacterized lipoprotein YajG